MKLIQIVFSPTGGTKKIAGIIAEKWKGTVTCIDLSDAGSDYSKMIIGQEDITLVAVPSYDGRIPGLVVERLREIGGNHARRIIFCVYGNRPYKRQGVRVLSPKRQKTVLAAVYALRTVQHRQLAGIT